MESERLKAPIERAMRGQIAAVFALMIVVITGFAGLAIDLAHARAIAEDAQRAADAAALAGVVYLPDSTSNAINYAAQLAGSNGFTDNCSASGTCSTSGAVQVQYGPLNGQPDPSTRTLQVRITEQVPTTFLKVLGFGSIAVSRSATATYADPITLGAPDHVLGFAPYPTKAVSVCPNGLTPGSANNCQTANPYAQGFFLELRGPYTGLEHGDAFSPYFASDHSPADTIMSTSGTGISRGSTSVDMVQSTCTPKSPPSSITTCQDGSGVSHSLQPNPYYDQQNPSGSGRSGYNFVVSFPPNMTKAALIKIMDPYDECSDRGKSFAGLIVAGPDGPSAVGSTPFTPGVSPELIDQCEKGPYYFSTDPATTLQLQVYEPTPLLADAAKTNPAPSGVDTGPAGAWTLTTADTSNDGSGNCNGYCNTQTFGDDPDSTGTLHAWHWFSYAEFQNTSNRVLYVLVNVQSVRNSTATRGSDTTPDPDGKGYGFGSGGNNFSLGVCKIDGSQSDVGDQANASEWAAAMSSTNTNFTPDGTSSGVDAGCADPNIQVSNDGYGCSTDPNNPDTCYHVNALTAFCLETLFPAQSDGTPYPSLQAVIPLAQIDQHFAGSDITLRLFDAGDIGSGNNLVNILGPTDDPNPSGAVGAKQYEKFSLDLSAPANSHYSGKGNGRTPSGGSPCPTTTSTSNSWWACTSTVGRTGATDCPADYNAYDHPSFDGPICPPLPSLDSGGGINTGVYSAIGGGNTFANDTWMDFHIHIPSNYNPQPDASGTLNDWWKVLYSLQNATANDTTTWEVVSGAAPVHLVKVTG